MFPVHGHSTQSAAKFESCLVPYDKVDSADDINQTICNAGAHVSNFKIRNSVEARNK